MPTIAADKIIGQDIYAKGSIDVLDKNFKPLKKLSAGQKIGKVYSYIENNDGSLYWMIYETDADYRNFNPIYVKHVRGLIECPALPEIIAEIERKKEQEAIERSGAFGYYLKKYLPWIVGAIAVAIVLPSLRKK